MRIDSVTMATFHVCARTFASAAAAAAGVYASTRLEVACVDSGHFRRRRQVYISDETAFDEKCKKIIAGGPKDLQILVDFDRTASTYWRDRAKRVLGESTYGVVELFQSPETKAAAHAMLAHYLPIETSHELTREQKIPHMEEWYRRANELLVGSRFRRDSIAAAVDHAEVHLRPGIKEMIRQCQDYNIPFVIFSAGIGNVIEEVLLKEISRPLPTSVSIVANWMIFDDKGLVSAMSEPIIHMFCKDETHVRHLPVYKELRRRKNVILMGDSLGDVTMADGLPHETVLRVGLLHDKVDLLLPQYMAAYDIVLVDDAPLHEIVDILDHVIRTGKGPGSSKAPSRAPA